MFNDGMPCVKIRLMAQQQENPIYWDQHATKWNLTLIFSLVVAVLGIVMMQPLLIILGLGMTGYSWLTTPRQFLLYRDSLVIVYGIPRTRVISYAEISHIELLALPLGERLRVRLVSGGRVMLMMRDPGAFRGHLEDALSRYHGEQSGTAFVDGAVLTRGEEPDYYASGDPDQELVLESVVESEDTFYQEDTSYQEETATPSGSYSEAGYTETTPDSYTENDPAPQLASETYPGHVESAPSISGSYTETAEPDFSGEGRPAYGADVELGTSTPEEEDPPERPRSPY